MRMWMIDPKCLCNKHLLGEHGEIHKHKHNFEKKHSVTGRLVPIVQIEPSSMELRHDSLANEMLYRGMNHRSEYKQPDISYLSTAFQSAKVDLDISKRDLISRCDMCMNRILNGVSK